MHQHFLKKKITFRNSVAQLPHSPQICMIEAAHKHFVSKFWFPNFLTNFFHGHFCSFTGTIFVFFHGCLFRFHGWKMPNISTVRIGFSRALFGLFFIFFTTTFFSRMENGFFFSRETFFFKGKNRNTEP